MANRLKPRKRKVKMTFARFLVREIAATIPEPGTKQYARLQHKISKWK